MNSELQPTDWQSVLLVGGYFLLFGLGAIAMQRWWIKKRQTEIPFGKDVRLLRQPGEGQMELFHKYERNESEWLVGTSMIPIAALWVMFSAFKWFSGYWLLGWAAVSFLVFAVSMLLAMRFLARTFDKQNDRYLGAFGERFIAECLEPLKQDGWSVFHDVPAEGKRKDFNLDHVVVGPRGLFVIETKTWRKKIVAKGEKAPGVTFDGKHLKGPHGVNNAPILQAEANADFLSKVLRTETGLDLSVKPLVTFPEWSVDFSSTASDSRTHVVKSDALVKFISRGHATLSEAQVDLVARAVGRRCRTVKY